MGTNQYYPPGCPAKPKYRLFAQYHAPQTASMKEKIFEEIFWPQLPMKWG